MFAGPGDDAATAQGGGAVGDPLTTPVAYQGSDGADDVQGGDGPDLLEGGGGPDVLRGRGGDDEIRGDLGRRDRLLGGADVDQLLAKDGRRDRTINCGPGANELESAKRDGGKDPPATSC